MFCHQLNSDEHFAERQAGDQEGAGDVRIREARGGGEVGWKDARNLFTIRS